MKSFAAEGFSYGNKGFMIRRRFKRKWTTPRRMNDEKKGFGSDNESQKENGLERMSPKSRGRKGRLTMKRGLVGGNEG